MKTNVETSLVCQWCEQLFGESDNSFQVAEHFINFLCYLNVIDAV